ncbi:MAG: hypothetical protein VB062_06615 [Christensenella sp.]|nr:hypothetical protein [Christensenella sp.]
MPQSTRKRHIVCKKCKTRFSGTYCPYCGAENGVGRFHRGRGGLLGGVLRFLLSLVALALLLVAAFVALDYIASAGGDSHSTARALLDSVRNGIPNGVLEAYASFKAAYLDHWVATVNDFFHVLFG